MGYTTEIFRKFLQAHDYTTGAPKIVRVADKKASTTNGGASTATTWNVRTLNTLVNNVGSLASLASNKVTLPAGTYRVKVSAPVYGAVGVTRVRLVNTTPDTDVVLLTGATLVGLASLAQMVTAEGVITLTETSALQVEHYTTGVVADTGLGYPASLTDIQEEYTSVEFEMLTDPNAATRHNVG